MSDTPLPRRSERLWTPARYRALLRARGPRSVQFRTRIAILLGAVAIGLAATAFAAAADAAAEVFTRYSARFRWAPLVTTPLLFGILVWLTRRYVPLARGSGIP
jgi:H+/Cl- antiporter ClcA